MHPTIPVTCENCGGGDSLALIIAVASVLLAAYAAVQARRAAKSAAAQLEVAQEEHRMVRAEHAAFLEQVNAHAVFRQTIELERWPVDVDGSVEVTGSAGSLTITFGIKNDGKKAATNTTMNVIVPAADRAVWSDADGRPERDSAPGVNHAEELLDLGSGVIGPAQYLATVLPTINTRSHYLRHVTLSMRRWPRPGEEILLPVLFKLESDDQAPDDPEARQERVFVLRGARQS